MRLTSDDTERQVKAEQLRAPPPPLVVIDLLSKGNENRILLGKG